MMFVRTTASSWLLVDFLPGDFLQRRTLEQRWSFKQAADMRFVDFASAFDSMDRWNAPQTLTAYYALTKMKVRASGSDSMPFEIRSGVRKGCALFPTLFNYIID